MLFRPPTEHRLDAARTLLDDWNGEADRFRRAAEQARRGEPPTPALAEAAHDVHGDVRELIDDLDLALAQARPGHPDFGRLLQVQVTALAIAESVERSLDLLDNVRHDASTGSQPVHTRGPVPH